jgi:ribonuclease G
VFDYAEAFTVIDVNTGRFVGGRGKASNARLEDTITKNNLEAVTEVVRQLRLRDIGGIIVIDFIDMANPKNRQLVEGALNTELGRDRTKTYVVEISPLGLVEMTRQNVTDGPREILTVNCATCDATGVVVSAETHAVEAERQLRKAVSSSRAEAFQVELHSDVAAILVGPDGSRLAELEKELGRRFAFKTKKSFRLDRFEILTSGKAAQILGEEPAPAEKPAPSRAKKATRAPKAPVALEDALDEPLDAEPSADGDAPAPEKPKKKTRRGTRGGRGRKRKTAAAAAGNGAAPDGAEPDLAAEAEAEAPSPAEVTGDGAGAEAEAEANGEPPAEEKPRKKTRRGSRGGRRRKKKTTTESADGGAIATAEDAG